MTTDFNSNVNLKLNKNRKKFIIFAAGGIALVTVILVLIKIPSSPLQKTVQKQSSVEIKTTYKNPFDKNTQYVNPFDNYKNPFVTNR